jgi:hypothetical protein
MTDAISFIIMANTIAPETTRCDLHEFPHVDAYPGMRVVFAGDTEMEILTVRHVTDTMLILRDSLGGRVQASAEGLLEVD